MLPISPRIGLGRVKGGAAKATAKAKGKAKPAPRPPTIEQEEEEGEEEEEEEEEKKEEEEDGLPQWDGDVETWEEYREAMDAWVARRTPTQVTEDAETGVVHARRVPSSGAEKEPAVSQTSVRCAEAAAMPPVSRGADAATSGVIHLMRFGGASASGSIYLPCIRVAV